MTAHDFFTQCSGMLETVNFTDNCLKRRKQCMNVQLVKECLMSIFSCQLNLYNISNNFSSIEEGSRENNLHRSYFPH